LSTSEFIFVIVTAGNIKIKDEADMNEGITVASVHIQKRLREAKVKSACTVDRFKY
jgi:hypothetical protein